MTNNTYNETFENNPFETSKVSSKIYSENKDINNTYYEDQDKTKKYDKDSKNEYEYVNL